MTHTIQNSIIICHINETSNENNNTLLVNTLLSFKKSYEDKNLKGIFISLKNIPLHNGPVLDLLIKQLDKASHTLGFPIAIGDYTKKDFEILKKITEKTQLKLFQEIQTATLLLNPSATKKELRILLFDEDENNAQKISSVLSTNGHCVIYAHTLEDFKQKASAQSFDMTMMQNCFNNKESLLIKPTLGLSKELIINLPVFIDTAVNALITTTGLEACKIKHEIKSFATLHESVIVASMRFKGELSGNFFLIFPKPLALLALESMLGEPVDENDTAAILDGIGEFCNIITGGAKVILSNKKLKVLFELPKTYLSLQIAMNSTSNANGIWIEMALDGKPFYMFVTA